MNETNVLIVEELLSFLFLSYLALILSYFFGLSSQPGLVIIGSLLITVLIDHLLITYRGSGLFYELFGWHSVPLVYIVPLTIVCLVILNYLDVLNMKYTIVLFIVNILLLSNTVAEKELLDPVKMFTKTSEELMSLVL